MEDGGLACDWHMRTDVRIVATFRKGQRYPTKDSSPANPVNASDPARRYRSAVSRNIVVSPVLAQFYRRPARIRVRVSTPNLAKS